MGFDIVFVTYNSEKWIDNCLESITKSDYDLGEVNIIAVDNNSSDKTVHKLREAKHKYWSIFKDFIIIEGVENLGFGKGNNLGFKQGNSKHVLFLNIDTEINSDTLKELDKYIEASSSTDAVWELRQFPYEHPKLYNPATLRTTWVSGAAFVVRRDVFEEVSGFDENIFMYAEDVDLSWRIRIKGYNLRYAPKAIVHHYCYTSANEVKPNQYLNSIINNLLLRYKFGSIKDILKGYLGFTKVMLRRGPFVAARKHLLIKFLKHFVKAIPFVKWSWKNKKEFKEFKPNFYGWDYETNREGSFYTNELPEKMPLVSIIVRTCGRPDMLRETLKSIENQTYKNIEAVIIEDGPNMSQEMINNEFSHMECVYSFTEKNVGRSIVGNQGIKMAKGKYINFLDDDDVFYSDHVEILVRQLEKNPDYRAAYTLGFETPIVINNKSPFEYTIMNYNLIHKQKFSKTLLFHHNYIPIQCIMFEKEIFNEEGGIDETLDALEDWDLWVRYACKNDFLYVGKVTSEYRIPFHNVMVSSRQGTLDEALKTVRKKHSGYSATINVLDTANDVYDIYHSFFVAITYETYGRIRARHPIMSKVLFKFFGLGRRFLR